MSTSKITKDYIKKTNQGQITETQPCIFFYIACLSSDVKHFPHTKFHSLIIIQFEDMATFKTTKDYIRKN